MAKKQVELLVQPRFMGLMTGTDLAKINGCRVTLIYTDGSRETATLTHAELAAGRENWMAMISAVQGKR